MLDENSGVATKIQEEQLKAFPTPFYCHSLNLSMKNLTKDSKLLSNAVDISNANSYINKMFAKNRSSLWYG